MPKIGKERREELAHECYRYKLQGKSYREIAPLVGVSHTTVGDLIRFHMESKGIPAVDTERIQQLDQADMAIEKLWRIIVEDSQLTQYGKPCFDSAGNPIVDKELKIKAAKELRGWLDTRAKLTGAYSPIRQDVTLSEGDSIDSAVANLIAEMESSNAEQRESLADSAE